MDKFENANPTIDGPASDFTNVTPDDGADLAVSSRSISVGASGIVQVTSVKGTTGPIYIAAGVPYPIRARRVWATSTTATGIVALHDGA